MAFSNALRRQDVSRFQIALEEHTNGGARAPALVALACVFGRERRTERQRQTERFDRHGHRVGGVHPTARARSRARVTNDVQTLLVSDRPGEILTVRLKRGNDVARLALSKTRADGAAVDHQRRPVETRHRDDTARHVLVAARNGDERVVPLRSHHRLDRVGDEVSRRQRVAHALGAHREAVAHADGIEAETDQARTPTRLL